MSVADYANLYHEAGLKYGVDPALLMAQGQVESGGDPNAEGPPTKYGRAEGLAQLIPDTARSLNVTDPDDPQQAIDAQARLMAENLHRYGDVEDALMAYHGGTNTQNWGEATHQYPGKVLANYKEYTMAQNDNQKSGADSLMDSINAAYQAANKSDAGKSTPAASKADQLISNIDAAYKAANAAPQTQQTQVQEEFKTPPKVGKPFLAQTSSGATDIPATAEDVAESLPTGFVEGVNNLPKIPGMGYTFARQLIAQGMNKLQSLAPSYFPEGRPLTAEEQAQRIQNAGNDIVGRTLMEAPTISQLPAVAMRPFVAPNLSYNELVNTPDINPVVTSLHQPTTGAGNVAEAATASIPGGRLFGLKTNVAIGGGVGAQLASEISPNNPFGQVIGGALGGIGPSAYNAAQIRTPPSEIANKLIQDWSDGGSGGGPPPPPGGGGGGIVPEDLVSNEIVPGSKPTLAQVTNNPNVALMERQMQHSDPAAFAEHERVNEAARQNYFEQASGTPEDVAALRVDRDTRTTPLYETASKQPLKPEAIQPVLDRIDAAIEQVGEGSDAGKTLIGIKSKIQNALPKVDEATGETIKNKTQSPLIQIYRETRDDLNKDVTAPGAYGASVKSIIRPINQALGQALESQSEPFAQAQQIYREMSPQIESSEWLQKLKLTDATGNYTLAKVNNALTNIQKLRSAPGVNPAKSLTDNQLTTLTNIRDDLLRRESVAKESMPRGSNTVQNAIAEQAKNSGLIGRVNKLAGHDLGRTVGAGLGGYLGSLFGWPGAGAITGELTAGKLGTAAAARAAEAGAHMQDFLLHPEAYKQYLINQQGNTFSARLMNNLLTNP